MHLGDRDAVALGRLSHLRRLTLPGCERLTPDGFRAIAGMPKLEELGIDDCRSMTDSDLKQLATPRRLTMLCLKLAPKLTDTGLREADVLPLRTFWIHGCEQLSSNAIEAFKRDHPRCDVTIEPNWAPYQPPATKK